MWVNVGMQFPTLSVSPWQQSYRHMEDTVWLGCLRHCCGTCRAPARGTLIRSLALGLQHCQLHAGSSSLEGVQDTGAQVKACIRTEKTPHYEIWEEFCQNTSNVQCTLKCYRISQCAW